LQLPARCLPTCADWKIGFSGHLRRRGNSGLRRPPGGLRPKGRLQSAWADSYQKWLKSGYRRMETDCVEHLSEGDRPGRL